MLFSAGEFLPAERSQLSTVPSSRIHAVWPLLVAVTLGLLRPAESYAWAAVVLAGLSLIVFLRSRPTCGQALIVTVVPIVLVPWCLVMPMPSAAVGALLPFAIAFGFAVGASRLADVSARTVLLQTFVVVAGLLALWGLWQRLYSLDAMRAALGTAEPGDTFGLALRARLAEGRAFAALPTPAAFAAVMAMSIPVAGELCWRAHSGLQRAFWGLLMFLSLAGLWAAASFTGLAALIGGGLLIAAGRPRLRRHALWAIPLAALAVAGLVSVRGAALWGSAEDPSPLRLRAGNVRIAGEMIADHPWAGVGPGMYGERYPQYRRAVDNESRHAHNLPAEWLAEWGLPLGSVFVLLFLFYFLAPALRATTRAGPAWAAAAFAVHNLLDFSVFLPSVLGTACLLCGLCHVRAKATAPATGRVLQFATMMALAVTALAVSDGTGRIYEEAAAAEARAERPQRALDAYARGLAWAPWNADLLIGRVASACQVADPRASAFLETAERRAPYRASLHAWAASLAERRRDPVDVWAHWSQAADLYPARKEYRIQRDAWAQTLVREADR
jgi:O-antigen ligase